MVLTGFERELKLQKEFSWPVAMNPNTFGMSKRRKTNLEKRLTHSKKLASQAEDVVEMLNRIPSFKGKAKFMDKAIRVQNNANLLVVELMVDLSEERER